MIANSIGAYFSMCAGIEERVNRAFFISPIVDMERLILDLMKGENVTEEELEKRGVIPTSFGEDLSFNYLRYVREHSPVWTVPTNILYGSEDVLTSYETISEFVKTHRAVLTVMAGGEHWFHTEEQTAFLSRWIKKSLLV